MQTNKKINYQGRNYIVQGFSSWIYAFLALLSLWPFFSWKWPVIPVFSIFLACFVFFCEFMAFYHRRISLYSATVIMFFIFFFFVFYQLPGGRAPWENYYSFFSIFLLLMPISKSLDVAEKFKVLFSYCLAPGLVVYFLLYFGFHLNYTLLNSHNEIKNLLGIFYRDYGVTISLSHLTYDIGGSTLIRYSGIFDEPGLVGTIAALLLIADKFDMRKKQNVILLLSGLASVSLIFYIYALIGLVFQSKKKWHGVSLVVVIGLVIYHSPIYDNYLGKRFIDSPAVTSSSYQSNSAVESLDNRTSSCFKEKYNEFLVSGTLTQLSGEGHNAHLNTLCDVSSYKMYIYDYGFIGSIILLILLCLQYFYPLSQNQGVNKFFYSQPLFLFLFFLSYYQRPVLFSLAFVMVFYYAILNSKKCDMKK